MATSETPVTPAEGTAAAATTDNPVATKLKILCVDGAVVAKITGDLGVETEADLLLLSETDLTTAGMKPIPAKRLLASLKEKPAAAAAAEAASMASVNTMSFDVLPAVPAEESWLQALRTGGVLKVDQSTVISAIRVALAHRVGLYGIPKKLADLMEEFADLNEEQVDTSFFKIRKELTRRNYAEVFEAIEGMDGSYVTEARKKKLLERVDANLWQSIATFNSLLQAWQDAYMKGAANPAMMMQAIMMATGGARMGPGIVQQIPETGGLRDAADAVADSVNRVFAGTGVQIAAAMGYEAKQIKDTLSDPRLPGLVGVANREQMLKKLDVAVPATYQRLETNLTRFVLAIMQVKDQAAGNEELIYFGSLAMLGSQIPWEDQLNVGLNGRRRPRGIGSEKFE